MDEQLEISGVTGNAAPTLTPAERVAVLKVTVERLATRFALFCQEVSEAEARITAPRKLADELPRP